MRERIEARLRGLDLRDAPVRSLRIEPPHAAAAFAAEVARNLQRAAVLIGFTERADGLHILLTRRAAALARHAGQVAFPGGRVDATDADVVATALREAEEEIGLSAAQVDVTGILADHVTGTGFLVTPVVGFLDADFSPAADPAEVASVFEVPLSSVLDETQLRPGVTRRDGVLLHGFEMHHGGERIWGATAAMLATLRELII